MSHWTTSGRSRLKAKQSQGRSSFSQKAQQRAAFVAAESMMMHGTAPREITTAANNKRHTETTTRRRKNEARTRYSFCNPIARRGVAVSIGSSANNDSHHHQQQQQQHYHDDDNQIESGCDDSRLSSENHPPQRRRIRRIRDASLRYRNLNSKRTTSSTMDDNTNNINYRPHIEAPTCTTPHQSVQNHHQPSDGSFQYRPDSYFQNNIPNPAYEEIRGKVPDKIIPRRHLSGRGGIVAPPPASFQEEDFPSDYTSSIDDFDAPLQIQQEWHHQQTLPNILNHPSQDYDDTTILPARRGGSQLQGGIKGFQKYNDDHVDPFEGVEVEGVEGDIFDFTNDSSWDNSNPVAVAGNDPGSSTIIRHFTEGTDNDIHRDYIGARNHNNYVDNTYFEQDQQMMSQNALTRRLSDITTESSLLEGSYSQSQTVGISRFSKNQRKRIRSEMTETEERGHESSSSNYNQCGNGMFEQAIISSSSEFSDLTSTSSGKDNHQGSLRFFDNSSEVDSRGNILEESMSPQTKRKLNFNALVTREQNNKCDTVNGNGNEMLTMDRRYKSNTNIDKSLRQQQTATTTSPDTNYLRGVEFENRSMWKYFC